MHELGLARDMLGRIDAMACEQGARRIVRVKVTLGALSGVSPDHLRRHFAQAARGTCAEGARLETTLGADVAAPDADSLRLESIDVEE